jgi:hypothetical protein
MKKKKKKELLAVFPLQWERVFGSRCLALGALFDLVNPAFRRHATVLLLLQSCSLREPSDCCNWESGENSVTAGNSRLIDNWQTSTLLDSGHTRNE